MATGSGTRSHAYEERQQEFEAEHPQKWVVFYDGSFRASSSRLKTQPTMRSSTSGEAHGVIRHNGEPRLQDASGPAVWSDSCTNGAQIGSSTTRKRVKG